MSRNPQHQSRDAKPSSNADDLQKIEDPENYNLKRRLRQIHTAREEVANTKRYALKNNLLNQAPERAETAIVEAAVDYVQELLPTLELAGASEPLLQEEVEYDLTAYNGGSSGAEFQTIPKHVDVDDVEEESTVTIASLVKHRGMVKETGIGTGEGSKKPLNYEASMKVWQICNRYFEKLAGPDLTEGLPEDMVDDEL